MDVSDLMRRLTKQELRKFDGSPLFPERRAYTIQYQLSDLEAQLYAAVTQYVRNEMRNLNDLAGDDKRRNNVGFALQVLQRRLASSPAAIFHSLRRRRERLEARLAEERIVARGERLQKQEQLPSARPRSATNARALFGTHHAEQARPSAAIVRSDLVVVFLVRCENVAKMALANHDDVIKTFPSDRADQP